MYRNYWERIQAEAKNPEDYIIAQIGWCLEDTGVLPDIDDFLLDEQFINKFHLDKEQICHIFINMIYKHFIKRLNQEGGQKIKKDYVVVRQETGDFWNRIEYIGTLTECGKYVADMAEVSSQVYNILDPADYDKDCD